jgi:hypothetical protein
VNGFSVEEDRGFVTVGEISLVSPTKFMISVVAGAARCLFSEPAISAAENKAEEVAFLFDGLTPVLGAAGAPLDAEGAILPETTETDTAADDIAVVGPSDEDDDTEEQDGDDGQTNDDDSDNKDSAVRGMAVEGVTAAVELAAAAVVRTASVAS